MCINVLFSVVILLLVCAITADIHQLHSTISRLQGIVASRCDLEGVCVSVCVCVSSRTELHDTVQTHTQGGVGGSNEPPLPYLHQEPPLK